MTTEAVTTAPAATTPESTVASSTPPADARPGTAPATPASSAAPPGQPAAPAAPAPVEKAADDAAGKPAPAVPEKYEFKAPEGKEFDPGMLKAYEDLARGAGMTQDAAQKMLDGLAPALASKQQELMAAAQTQWEAHARADKEFGGDKFEENLGFAKAALKQFGTAELLSLLDASPIGSHPELIRAFYRVGKAIAEDRIVGGSKAGEGEKSVAQRMYPNMNP